MRNMCGSVARNMIGVSQHLVPHQVLMHLASRFRSAYLSIMENCDILHGWLSVTLPRSRGAVWSIVKQTLRRSFGESSISVPSSWNGSSRTLTP